MFECFLSQLAEKRISPYERESSNITSFMLHEILGVVSTIINCKIMISPFPSALFGNHFVVRVQLCFVLV
jgi:hypothetical protein